MGRPKKPTALLEASGAFKKNPKRRRTRGPEPCFLRGAECPAWLEGDARRIWERLAEHLDAANLLKRPHADALAGAAMALHHAIEADRILAAEGHILRESTKAGVSTKAHPAFGISTRAWNSFRLFCSEFGLSPKAAAAIAAPESSGPKTLEDVLSAPGTLPDLGDLTTH